MCVDVCVCVYNFVCVLVHVYSFVCWCVCLRVMVFVCAVLIYTRFIVPLLGQLAPFFTLNPQSPTTYINIDS